MSTARNPGKSSFSLSSFSFFFLFSLRNVFLFSLFSFLFPSFLLFFPFSLFSSHFPFISPHFLFSFLSFSLPFWRKHSFGLRRQFPPPFLYPFVWPTLFHFSFSYFLNPFYDIIHHMASCEPWDSIPTHG